jgi:hypothetical protein
MLVFKQLFAFLKHFVPLAAVSVTKKKSLITLKLDHTPALDRMLLDLLLRKEEMLKYFLRRY